MIFHGSCQTLLKSSRVFNLFTVWFFLFSKFHFNCRADLILFLRLFDILIESPNYLLTRRPFRNLKFFDRTFDWRFNWVIHNLRKFRFFTVQIIISFLFIFVRLWWIKTIAKVRFFRVFWIQFKQIRWFFFLQWTIVIIIIERDWLLNRMDWATDFHFNKRLNFAV